ncbi:MAG: alginate export family protein [Nitrospirae bacterium]|nr:alginate export family protein [Nitrospirota bacterium]
MKKILSILLGMLLVFGFAASAFALHTDIPSEDSTPAVAAGTTSITLSGEIRERYDTRAVYFNKEVPMFQRMDSRVRLGFDAKMSPNTEGFVMLESTNEDSSDTAGGDLNYWGAGATGKASTTQPYNASFARGSFGGKLGTSLGDEPKGFMGIREAWILHQGTGLLGVNSGFKVGHMSLILGNGLFFNHTYYGDDAALVFVNPIKELELDALAIRLNGQSLNLSSDVNAYVFAATYKPDKKTSIGFDVTYLDGQNLGDTATVSTLLAGPVTPSGLSTSSIPSVHLWNFGLRGNTEIAGLGIYVDGEIQTGSEDMSGQPSGALNLVGGTGNMDFKGKAIQAGINYKLNPVKLSLDYAYGSGDSGNNKNNFNTFVTTVGPEQHYTYVYEYRTTNAAGTAYGGLQNTWYLHLGANADVMKDLNADLGVYYLRAANALTGDNGANTGNLTRIYTASTGLVKNDAIPGGVSGSTSIGTEVDGKLTYKIDKGLQVFVEGGYLWAGSFWKNYYTVAGSTYGQTKVDNVWVAREGIQLNF